MTHTTNARLAGFMFLFYIATGIAGAVLFNQATGGETTAAKIASIAAHVPQMRLSIVFTLITIFNAFILGVALYTLTRAKDPDLALLALACRIGEGVINAISSIAMLMALWLAIGAVHDAAAANWAGDLLLKVQAASLTVSATLFAVGSTLFSYLFLRAKSIPTWLAWLGLLGSILLVITLPLEGIRLIGGSVAGLIWLPALVFEVTLGLWLLIKGKLLVLPKQIEQ
jgi:Domain of unknown function (DUF4386)